MMLRGVKSMRQLFAKTGGPNAAANGSSTIRRVWKPRFCMSVTARTSRENTNPKRRRGARQFDCGKEDGPSLTRRVSMTDHLDFGGDRQLQRAFFAVIFGGYLVFAKKEPARSITLPPPGQAPK